MSYELVYVSLFSQVYNCGGIKTARTKTTKNTLDTGGNHQQYTGIKKKGYISASDPLMVSLVRRKAQTTRSVHSTARALLCHPGSW